MDSRPHLLVDTAYKRPSHRRPVWMMRQAGRYLPEYQEIRARHGFLEMCRTPDLAVQISMQPYQRFKVDAVIFFSDILFVPEAMGLSLDFTPGPVFANPVREVAHIDALHDFDPEERLPYIYETLRELRAELHDEVPLIGFAGAPFTLATYMVEGEHSKHLQYIMGLRYTQPAQLHKLLEKISTALVKYLKAQMDAGAQVIQLFDSFAGQLTPTDYRRFALPYTQRVIQEIRRDDVPIILFVKGCAAVLEMMADSGADVLSVDWMVDMADARARVGDRVALQGNLDPLALLAPPESISEHVSRLLESFGHHHGLIGNLGHGVLPFIDPEHAGQFIRKFKEMSRGYSST